MLTLKKFEYGLSLLQQNYDRTLTEAIKQLWFHHLDEHLTDEEFLSAVKHSILHSRFMPTAGELVDHIHGGKEVKAIQEWDLIVKAAARSDAEEQLAYVSDRARVALKAIGGIHAVGQASSVAREGQLSEQQRLEKKFVTVYCQCSSSDRKAIAQVSTEEPVEPSDQIQSPAPMPEHLKQQVEQLKTKFAMNGKKD